METLSVLIWMSCGPVLLMVTSYLLYHYIVARYLFLAYLIWIYLDRDTCERGGRRYKVVRKGSVGGGGARMGKIIIFVNEFSRFLQDSMGERIEIF